MIYEKNYEQLDAKVCTMSECMSVMNICINKLCC